MGSNDPKDNGTKDPLEWEEVSTEHIVNDEWMDIRRSEFRLPDGKVFGPYYTYSRRDYVVIVATDTNGDYICVRQFRQGVRRITTEFPAGGIERNDGRQYGRSRDGLAEDALEAAKRELLEETGYVSGSWEHLLTVPSNATIADNYAHIFSAGNCTRAGGQDLDETEFLNITLHSRKELDDMIKSGEFAQATHILAMMLADRDN